VGDLEGETAAAVDLRALTREEGEVEEPLVRSCKGGIAVGSGGADRGRELRIGTSMKPRQEGKEHMGCLVGWASPLLTRLLSFSFFLSFFLHLLL
jgi:hypothetical protein